MKIDDVEIGAEYVTRWYRQRVRAEEVAMRETSYGPAWQRGHPKHRQVRVTYLNDITGEPLATQPDPGWLPARELTGDWQSHAAEMQYAANRGNAQNAAFERLQSGLLRHGFGTHLIGRAWQGYSIEVSVTPEEAHKLADLLERV